MIMFLILLIILILMMLIILVNLMSKNSFYDREKNSPFECGFDPKTSARLPFSLQFFMVGVIFLIFDIEITLLFPLILILKITNLINYTKIIIIFISILLIGIYHEWKQGALEWMS